MANLNIRSKSQMLLMEFIIVVLFFSVFAAICTSVFIKADVISRESNLKGSARLLAQNVASLIQAEDNNTLLNEYGISVSGGSCALSSSLKVMEEKDAELLFSLSVSGYDKLPVYNITITNAKGEPLYNLSFKQYKP